MMPPAQSDTVPSGAAAQRTILVADDEPSIVMSLEFLLKKAGFRVLVARTGEEVLRLLQGETPDLVLLDAMMPERDGYAVCQQIRTTPRWSTLPVIMLTAKSREVERQKGMALGATDYVTKPFSTRELVDTVRRHLENGHGAGAAISGPAGKEEPAG